MIKTGICSITFRQLDLSQIVALVKKAELDAIEWGGDLHVKPGDILTAREALRRTTEAGLAVSSYGSYYSVLGKDGTEQEFEPVLDSALELGTDTVRIWPGVMSSEVATKAYRVKFIEKLRIDLDAAAAQGVRLAMEFHINSLSDSNAAALALLGEVNHPNLYTYWQPMYWIADSDYRLRGLEQLADHVINLHVFQWHFHPMRGSWSENIERRPLAEGALMWKKYFSVPLLSGEHYALMEFVQRDDPYQFFNDARILNECVLST